MADPRITKLAKILVEHSVNVKKGEKVVIKGEPEAKELLLEVYKLVIQKGAYPIMNVGLPGSAYIYYKHASKEQLTKKPTMAMYEAKQADAFISIGAESNTKELSNIDPERITTRRRVTNPVSEVVLKKKWVYCEIPTNALAQDAEMSLEEFEDFAYNSMLLDWKKESKRQDKIKAILDKGKKVRIIGEDTDITFGIKGRKGVKCPGNYNMPDGEVFIAPEEKTTEGHISYTFPVIRAGREVDGVKLWFEKGKVIKATATKNQKFLESSLNTDKGARYLGEFGIGLNFGIKKFIKQILFDEKIGGTIHLALGRAYPEGGGVNKSALHWDMIKDLRKKGEFQIDGKTIMKNGKFKIKL